MLDLTCYGGGDVANSIPLETHALVRTPTLYVARLYFTACRIGLCYSKAVAGYALFTALSD